MYATLPPLLAACSTLSTRGQAGWHRRRGKRGREGEVRADGSQLHSCVWCWRSSTLKENNETHKEPRHNWLLMDYSDIHLWTQQGQYSQPAHKGCAQTSQNFFVTLNTKQTKSLTLMKTRWYFLILPTSFRSQLSHLDWHHWTWEYFEYNSDGFPWNSCTTEVAHQRVSVLYLLCLIRWQILIFALLLIQITQIQILK